MKSGEGYILWTVAISQWSLQGIWQLSKHCNNTQTPNSNLKSYHDNCKDIVWQWLQTVTNFLQSRRVSDFFSNTLCSHSHSFLFLTQTKGSVSHAVSEFTRELKGGTEVVFHIELSFIYREGFRIPPPPFYGARLFFPIFIVAIWDHLWKVCVDIN